MNFISMMCLGDEYARSCPVQLYRSNYYSKEIYFTVDRRRHRMTEYNNAQTDLNLSHAWFVQSVVGSADFSIPFSSILFALLSA